MVIVAVLALVLVSGLIFYFATKEPEGTGTLSTNLTPTEKIEPSTPPAEVQPVAPTEPTAAELLDKITTAMTGEDWDQALSTCQALPAEAQEKAEQPCDTARQEKEAAGHFERFHSAMTGGNYLDAIRHHNRIPDQSVYKAKSPQLLAEARSKYLTLAYKELDALLDQHECIRAGAVKDQILEVDPSADAVSVRVKACAQPVASLPPQLAPAKPARPAGDEPPRRRPPRVRPEPGEKPRPVEKPAVDNSRPTLEELEQGKNILNQASQAYVAGNHAKAITLAKKALTLHSSQKMAIQIIGASSCYLKKDKDAKWAYGRLPPAQRNLLKKVCERNGVELE